MSVISAEPYVGTPNEPVLVKWKLSTDKPHYIPQLNDEVCLLTSSNTLVARQPLDAATFLGDPKDDDYSDDSDDGGAPCIQVPKKEKEELFATNGKKEIVKDKRFTRSGRCSLICPSTPGGFILALVEGHSGQRVIASPFRVAGPPFIPAKSLHITSAVPVKPFGRIDVMIPLSDLSNGNTDVVVVCESSTGDNKGMCVCRGPYDHAESVFIPPHRCVAEAAETKGKDFCTLSIVGPEKLGTYQIRLMQTPACSVAYAPLVSSAFSVVHRIDDALPRNSIGGDIDDERKPGTADFAGTLTTKTHSCMVGEMIEVTVDITSDCGAHLCELDEIVMYPYGRSESIIQTESVSRCIGEKRFHHKLLVMAPLQEGFYDIAYFSFSEQHPVINGVPIQVTAPCCEVQYRVPQGVRVEDVVSRYSASTARIFHPSGGSFSVDVQVDCAVFSRNDRVLVFDERSNVVESVLVDTCADMSLAEGTRGANTIVKANVEVCLHGAGKYMVRYYSFKLGRMIGKLNGFVQISSLFDDTITFPVVSLCVVRRLPINVPVNIYFSKESQDSRPRSLQVQDCLVLTEASSPDILPTAYLDDSKALPAMELVYLRGVDELDSKLKSIKKPGRYSLRYLVALRHFTRLCIAECIFEVLEDLPGFAYLPLSSVAPNDIAPVTHRIERGGDGNLGVSPLPSPGMSVTSTALSGTPGSSPDGNLHVRTNITGNELENFPSSGAAATPMARPSFGRQKHITGHPHFQSIACFSKKTEFRGALLPPASCSTTEQVLCTFHITEGVPRGSDMIVLLPEDCNTIISEVKVADCLGRPDFTLGTAVLNPPRLTGKHAIGYFSTKYKSIVLVSEFFRITGTVITADASTSASASAKGGQKRRSITGARPGGGGADGPMRRSTLASTSNLLEARGGGDRFPRVRVLAVAVSYLRRFFELKGPLNDVEHFCRSFRRLYKDAKVEEKVLHELNSEMCDQPTAQSIREGIRWLLEDARPKDHLVLYFSGFGSRMPDTNDNRAFEDTFLPMDFDWGSRMIRYSELRKNLFEMVPPGTYVSAIIDACFTSNHQDLSSHLGIWKETNAQRSNFDRRGMHKGIRALWTRREKEGIPGNTPWKCIPPPRGTMHKFCTAPNEDDPDCTGVSPLLFQPRCALPNRKDKGPITTPVSVGGGANACFVIYEGCRNTLLRPEGAWDMFFPENGCTMGCFTHVICEVLEEHVRLDAEQAAAELEIPVEERGQQSQPVALRWWQLHEEVSRKIEKRGYGQHPRLLVGDDAALDTDVCAALTVASDD